MFFLNENNKFGLMTVLEFTTKPKDVDVAPRPFHALSFRLSGNATFTDGQNTVHVGTGEMLYMPAGKGYHLCSEGEHIICMHFTMSEKTEPRFAAFTPASEAVFREAFCSLAQVWNNKRPGYNYKAMSLFYKILEQMTRQFSLDYLSGEYVRIEKAVTYIHEHFADPNLDIPTLCAMAHLSDTQLRKLFSRVFSMTPLQYINTLRTDYAADLLEGGLLSVEEVAYRSGFADAKYFATVFKKYKGCTPSAFKCISE
ncbi:MAG: helix-turn-helix domain-containing protein [Clostridia bacterium]|nr:helix-turn-helix domain-containing protein [Clostridia bacterium]